MKAVLTQTQNQLLGSAVLIERPPEWWSLWDQLKKPVEQVYNKFPSIKTNCTIETVLDYTTNEVFPRITAINQSSLMSYARKVAHRFCLKIKEQLVKGKPAIDSYYNTLRSNDQISDHSELMDRVSVEACMVALKKVCSKEEFIVLYLHFYKGQRFVQIAETLCMNENTVKSHKKRGLEKLYDYFTQNC